MLFRQRIVVLAAYQDDNGGCKLVSSEIFVCFIDRWSENPFRGFAECKLLKNRVKHPLKIIKLFLYLHQAELVQMEQGQDNCMV